MRDHDPLNEFIFRMSPVLISACLQTKMANHLSAYRYGSAFTEVLQISDTFSVPQKSQHCFVGALEGWHLGCSICNATPGTWPHLTMQHCTKHMCSTPPRSWWALPRRALVFPLLQERSWKISPSPLLWSLPIIAVTQNTCTPPILIYLPHQGRSQ